MIGLVQASVVLAAANNNAPDLLSQISTVVQIAFFAATGMVAILSYITAKKTIFQPLRTEIFKRQIEDLSSVLRLFSGKGEVALRKEFSFDDLITANIAVMYDAYLAFAFNMARPEEVLEYRHELCPSAMVLPEALQVASDYRVDNTAKKNSNIPEEWDYKAYAISIPTGFSDKVDEFQVILDSPLLPKSIAGLLEKYFSVVEEENITIIREVIEQSAEEMPAKYPTLGDIEHSSFNWILNRIAHQFQELEPTAKMINENVRAYFDSDNLLPAPGNGRRIIRRVRSRIKHDQDGISEVTSPSASAE
jgi:hypothetical protein